MDTLRREPYRLLFPLGALLGAAGVLPWLLLALGVSHTWHAPFHSLVQVEGFLTCFALGFLYTFIPRRTGTPGPSPLLLGLSVLLPLAVTALAWGGAWLASQVLYGGQLLLVLLFVLRRVRAPAAGRRVPEGMVWVPLALGMGMGGALLSALPPSGAAWLHGLGTGLLLQGMFTGLVLGVGGMLLPVLLHGGAPLLPAGPPRRRVVALHVGAALLFAASFALETWVATGPAFALRAGVVALTLIPPAQLWEAPRAPGLHRRLIWVAAWLLPAGYALVALVPAWRTAGLHVAFVGSFGLMALGVGAHVVLSHGGHERLLSGRPWQVGAVGALLAVALAARLLMVWDGPRLLAWLGVAATGFLLATLAWLLLVLPRVRGTPRPHA